MTQWLLNDSPTLSGGRLPLPRLRPAGITDVLADGDLVVTVCDLAHEELGQRAALHWSVRGPVPVGDPGSFDATVTELADRVRTLAPRLLADVPCLASGV